MQLADDSRCADVFVREPAFVEAVDSDERACMGRVDQVSVASVDPDVPGLLSRPVGAGEKDEIAGLKSVRSNPDPVRGIPLRRRVVRERDAELREYVLDEPRAVEAGLWTRAPPHVRDA